MPDHGIVSSTVQIDATGQRSLDEGIMVISSMAEGYAKPYIPQIWHKLKSDLSKAGFEIVAIKHGTHQS